MLEADARRGLVGAEDASLHSGLSSRERDRLGRILSVWSDRIASRNIHEEGVYIVQRDDNQGEPLQIFHYSYLNKLDKEIWFFAAVDSDQRLVGIRHTTLGEDDSMLLAEGDIEVLTRGQGVGGALEALHHKKLQEKINNDQQHTALRYDICDANFERINFLRSDLDQAEKDKDSEAAEELRSDLEQKKAQRKAWIGLYGDGGKLGFRTVAAKGLSPILTKVFVPRDNQDDMGFSIKETQSTLDLNGALSSARDELQAK